MSILAIDQGTSGTKVLLLDGELIISQASARLEVMHLPNGRVECDPQAIWKSIILAVTEVVNTANNPRINIEAVSLANQGESVLAWSRKTLEPLSPVMIWQDSRSENLCKSRAKDTEKIRELSGLENDPYFVAPKIRWLADNLGPDVTITTLDTWLIAKLTNTFVTDISTASRSMLLNLQTGSWDQELLNIWHLENHELPKIVNNDDVIGEISAPDLPMLKGIPLAGLIVDQAAALLAENCLELGEAKCTYGTGAFLLSNIGDQPKISTSRLSTSYAWNISGDIRFYEDGQIFTAASAVDWMITNQIIKSLEEIDSLPIDTQGVYALPGFAGYGAPRWQPNGSAIIAGLTLGSTKEHIARAILNGIAAQVTELTQIIKKDGSRINSMKVDGGLTQSKTLMQFQADIAQVEIEVFPHPNATAIGVGVLGRLAIDKTAKLSTVLPPIDSKLSYSPRWSKDRAETFMSDWLISTSRG